MLVEDRRQRVTQPVGQLTGVRGLLLAEASRPLLGVEGFLLQALDQHGQRVVAAGDGVQDHQGSLSGLGVQEDLGPHGQPVAIRVSRVRGLAVPAHAVAVEALRLVVDQRAADDLVDAEAHGLEGIRRVSDLHQDGEAVLGLTVGVNGHDLSLHVVMG